MDSVGTVLHPSLYKKLLRQVGASMGRSASRHHLETHQASGPFSRQDYLLCVEGLKERWGWDCSADETTEDSITFRIPTCPFGACAAETPDICLVESGILGGIAGDHFGESKVSIQRGEGSPPRNCRIVVYLRRSEQSAAAEGAVYPEETGVTTGLVLEPKRQPSLERLSRRERQILRLVGEGLSNKKIAAALHLSVRTIEGHLGRMYVTLAVKGRPDLIRLALRSTLTDL
jgi:DNA-binding CsgD family transcriptional regulator